MNARNVGSPFLRNHILSYIRENIQERNPMSVRNVGKPLSKSHNSLHIRRHTHGKGKPTNSMSQEFRSEFIIQHNHIIHRRETTCVSLRREIFQPKFCLVEYQQMHREKKSVRRNFYHMLDFTEYMYSVDLY